MDFTWTLWQQSDVLIELELCPWNFEVLYIPIIVVGIDRNCLYGSIQRFLLNLPPNPPVSHPQILQRSMPPTPAPPHLLNHPRTFVLSFVSMLISVLKALLVNAESVRQEIAFRLWFNEVDFNKIQNSYVFKQASDWILVRLYDSLPVFALTFDQFLLLLVFHYKEWWLVYYYE